MASVPSVGCLLAKNQYYRSKCTAGRVQCCPSLLSNGWAFSPLAGLPELIDKCWWIKSFFHNEPSPPTVGRKTLSAS
ncbi:Pancreatic progenitor cell differentiation and proliferation factor-like, partial [Nestor notabilis]